MSLIPLSPIDLFPISHSFWFLSLVFVIAVVLFVVVLMEVFPSTYIVTVVVVVGVADIIDMVYFVIVDGDGCLGLSTTLVLIPSPSTCPILYHSISSYSTPTNPHNTLSCLALSHLLCHLVGFGYILACSY